MTADRRLFVRYRCALPVEYAVIPEAAFQRTTTRNISGSGMNLFVDRKLTAGARLALRLLLPGRVKPISCVGLVMWGGELLAEGGGAMASHFEAGIHFTDIEPADQAAIIGYAAAHAVAEPLPE